MAEENELTDDSSLVVGSTSTPLIAPSSPQRPVFQVTSLQNPKEANKSPKLTVLPHEVTVEILSRLPVRSLIRFHCVSKSVKSLISGPCFIKTHLKRIKFLLQNKPDLSSLLYSFTSAPPAYDLLMNCRSIHSIFNDLQINATVPYSFPLMSHRFVGSCDGLVCMIAMYYNVLLWNPFMCVFNQIPVDLESKESGHIAFGFGHESETDDYKVVAVHCIGKSTRVKVYSLKSGCWRSVEGFSYGYPEYDSTGIFVNGSIVWPVKGESGRRLISFDLAKETYKEIKKPNCRRSTCTGDQLGVLDGCLSVLCTCSESRADIWVMREYELIESWIKLVTIPQHCSAVSSNYCFPHFIADNGEVLLTLKHHYLVIYNPQDGTFRRPMMNNVVDFWQGQTFFESLVSPKVVN